MYGFFHVKFMGFEMISWDLMDELGWFMGLTIMFMGFFVGLKLIYSVIWMEFDMGIIPKMSNVVNPNGRFMALDAMGFTTLLI